MVVPDSVRQSPAHPHLLIGSGKEGVIYLIDRDNMGKFGLHNNIVQNTGQPAQRVARLGGDLQRPDLLRRGLRRRRQDVHHRQRRDQHDARRRRSPDAFAFAGSTPSVSANGTSDGIVWDIDRGTNQLRAYSTDSYATELYTSDQAANGRDALGAAVKFQVADRGQRPGVRRVRHRRSEQFPGRLRTARRRPNAVPDAPSNLAAQPRFQRRRSTSLGTDNSVTPE